MKVFAFVAVFVAGCCDYKEGEIHEVARKDDCVVYQVACDHVFYAKCAGSQKVTTSADCPVRIPCGKSICCHQEYASSETIAGEP